MTREELIEVMARALYECDPIVDKTGALMKWADFSTRDLYGTVGNLRDDCRAALAALEAAGVRLVPERITPEMAVCLESNFAVCEPASALHAANWQSAYKAALAASPYAPKDQTHESD